MDEIDTCIISSTFWFMSQAIPTGTSPGKIFLSERIPATRAVFCLIPCPRAENDSRIPGVGQNFPRLEETAPMYQSIPSLTIPPGDPRSHCPGVGFSPTFLCPGGSEF